MKNFEDRFNDYINANPRQSLMMLIMAISLIWHTGTALVAFLVFAVAKIFEIKWWYVLGAGLLCVALGALFGGFNLDLHSIFSYGFIVNKIFWRYLLHNHPDTGFSFLLRYGSAYIASFSVLLAGVLSGIGHDQVTPYTKARKSLQDGNLLTERKEVNKNKLDKKLSRLNDDQYDATVLGVSKYSGDYVTLPDHYINQIVLVLGTTGSGKTITLRRFYQRAIKKGYPLIVIDGKPTTENVEWMQALAEKYGRTFYGFNCANQYHYNCLANGGYTELKDKVISLKDHWENDYYRSIAEDYLQTTFEVLQKARKIFDLRTVAQCLDFESLMNVARETRDANLIEKASMLENYDRKDITGLRAHLNILLNSELGEFFTLSEKTFTLPQIIDENAVVYFALPALRFPSFSKVLGKLVINDIKAVIDHYDAGKKIFTVFDEFSVFAGEQVLNLVNMGRGKGVHAIFGTQGLADLDRVDVTFKNQIMNCANTIICHRLNDQQSAEGVTNWIGTHNKMAVTAQIDTSQSDVKLGTVRYGKEFIIHPDDIKQELRVGEAFYITKVGQFWQDKVMVKFC